MQGHMEDEGGGGGSLRLQAAQEKCVGVHVVHKGSKIVSVHSKLSNITVSDSVESASHTLSLKCTSARTATHIGKS